MRKMKKIAAVLLVFALVAGAVPSLPAGTTEVLASDATSGSCGEKNGDNVKWEVTVDSVEGWDLETKGDPLKLTLTGSGRMESYLGAERVPWNSYRGRITSVSVSEGITSIAPYAFAKCVSLKSVTLPDSVEEIEMSAFDSCTLLETVNLGTGIKNIGISAFYADRNLKQIQLPEGLEIISNRAFTSSGLNNLVLPDSVTSIGFEAFYGMSFAELTIPRSAVSISGKFLAPGSVRDIRVADGNEQFFVQDHILYEKKDGVPYRAILCAAPSTMGDVSIAQGTSEIEKYAFYHASYISSVTIPDSVAKIGECAFLECYGIEEAVIPDSVTEMGRLAFGQCDALKTVSIGKGLKTFSAEYVRDCPIAQISISQENPYLESIDNVIFDEQIKTLCYYAANKGGQIYYVPDSVETIREYAITDTTLLEKLYLPESLMEIGNFGVQDNKKLKDIYFRGNAPTINYTSIGGIIDMILYHTASSTGWNTGVWPMLNKTITTWDPKNTTQESGVVGKLSWTYRGMDGSLTFTGSGEIPDFTAEKPAPWNSYMNAILTVEAPGVTGIGAYAFSKAENLVRLESGDCLTKIGEEAFADCGKFAHVDFSNAEMIGAGAFRNNTSLTYLMLYKAASVGTGAYQGCSSVIQATLGAHLETLEEEVFAGCVSLESLFVPDSVTEIKANACRGCTKLHSINIPAGVTTLGDGAFSQNTTLEKVYFYGEAPAAWSGDSFTDCSESLTLYYRKQNTGWEQLGGSWQNLPVVGLERFYTGGKDTYSFGNQADSFGYGANYKFSRQQWVDALGDIISGTYYYALNQAWTGSCYGMVTSAMEFYENPDFDVKEYDAAADCLHDLAAPGNKDAALTKLIEKYHLSQYTPPIAGSKGAVSSNLRGYRALIQEVEEFERSGGLRTDSAADPVIMFLFAKCSGHAVIPVSVEQDDDGNFAMMVYDPNAPTELKTLTVLRDLSGISYGWYTAASYVHYSEIAATMRQESAQAEMPDDSLYLSIDKENGIVTDEAGKGISEIEGAYEQMPFNGSEEDVFTGIKSFVLPKGNYQLAVDESETSGSVGEEEGVTFYLSTGENFAQVTSPDKTAVLTIDETGAADGLSIELQSDDTQSGISSFTLMDESGMERTVEVQGGNAAVTLAEDKSITVRVSDETAVKIDGKDAQVIDGQATGSFAPAPGEEPYRLSELETDVRCDAKNRLSGSVRAEVVSNAEEAKEVTVTADYLDSTEKKVASYSQKVQLQKGLNFINQSFENLETAFSKIEGDETLTCRLMVEDSDQNKAEGTAEGITVTLTKQGDTENPIVTGVTVSPETANVEQGKTQKFTAAVSGENNPATEVTWGVSGNRSAATKIAADGTLTVGADEAAATVTVTATSKADATKSGTATVTVTRKTTPGSQPTVTAVAVTPKTANVEQGKTQKFTATVSGENNPATEVTWGVSGNRSAATKIAADGTLTIGADEAAATVTVTATSKADATKSGTATVTVVKNSGGDTEKPGGGDTEKPGGGDTEKPGGGDAQKPGGGNAQDPQKNVAVKKVNGVPKKLVLGIGESYQLKASVTPKNAADKKLSYRSSSKKVSVSVNGRIKAKKTGRASITVTAHNGKKAVLNVTVRKAPKTIKLNAKKKTLKAGSTFQIKVKLPKGTASYKKTFTSSKKSVAAVSASGKVKAKKKGTATITVKTFNGKKAKLKIVVKNK